MVIIPPLNTSGLWSLSAPFNSLLIASIPYRLIAIRYLSELLAAGNDPETDYYTANSLIGTEYVTDLEANVAILSLQGEGRSDVVHVPSSYVTRYPDIGGVPYRVLALTINLGAIPDSLNLSNVISKVEADIKELIGVTVAAKAVIISPTTLLSLQDAAALEAARLANVTTAITDYTRYVQANAQLVTALQKIGELEAYLLQLKNSGVI